jgi:hypothetical protein
MTMPVSIFSILILVALGVVVVSPVVLLILWIMDVKKGSLW